MIPTRNQKSIFSPRIIFSFIALSCIFFSSSAHAESENDSMKWGGRLYTDQYLYLASPQGMSRFEQSSYSAWLDFSAQLSHDWNTHWIGEADLLPQRIDSPQAYSQVFRLREGYFTYNLPSMELKIGQQITPWGKSDGVNPTDYFSAKNNLLLNPDEEVKRLGAPGLHLTYTPREGNSPFNFQFVFQASYEETKLLIPTQTIPAGIEWNQSLGSPALFSTQAMEFGLKIAYLKNDFDFSISFFHGFSHLPEYLYHPLSQSIDAYHPGENAVGGDFSFTEGDSIIRGETALILLENGSSTDPLHGLVEPNHWDSVIGIERSFFGDYRAQIQLLYRYHFSWISPNQYQGSSPLNTLLSQSVGNANAILLNYYEASNLGTTFRVSYSNEANPWSADLFLLGYFSHDEDFLLRPQLNYRALEGLKLTLGLDWYGGPSNLPLGALKAYSAYFFDGRYLF